MQLCYVNVIMCHYGNFIMLTYLFHTMQPLQDHLSSTTLLTCGALSSRRPEWKCRKFLSVTSKQPFQGHFPPKTFISTQRSVSQDNILKPLLSGNLYNEHGELRLPQGHQWMAIARPSCHKNYHINWTNMQRLPHCDQWMAFWTQSSTKNIILTQSSVPQEDRLSSVSQKNGLKLCLPDTSIMNMQTQGLPWSPKIPLFNTIFLLQLLYQLESLSPARMAQSSVSQRPEQWTCRAQASPGSSIHSHFKTTFPIETITYTQSCLQWDINKGCAEPSPPQ